MNPIYQVLRSIAEYEVTDDSLWLREEHWRYAQDNKWTAMTTMQPYLDCTDDLETIRTMVRWISDNTTHRWATTGFRTFWFENPRDTVLFKLIWAD